MKPLVKHHENQNETHHFKPLNEAITTGAFLAKFVSPMLHLSQEKRTALFSIESWLLNRDPMMVYYNPHITGKYNPLYTRFFHCSSGLISSWVGDWRCHIKSILEVCSHYVLHVQRCVLLKKSENLIHFSRVRNLIPASHLFCLPCTANVANIKPRTSIVAPSILNSHPPSSPSPFHPYGKLPQVTHENCEVRQDSVEE